MWHRIIFTGWIELFFPFMTLVKIQMECKECESGNECTPFSRAASSDW